MFLINKEHYIQSIPHMYCKLHTMRASVYMQCLHPGCVRSWDDDSDPPGLFFIGRKEQLPLDVGISVPVVSQVCDRP